MEIRYVEFDYCVCGLVCGGSWHDWLLLHGLQFCRDGALRILQVSYKKESVSKIGLDESIPLCFTAIMLNDYGELKMKKLTLVVIVAKGGLCCKIWEGGERIRLLLGDRPDSAADSFYRRYPDCKEIRIKTRFGAVRLVKANQKKLRNFLECEAWTQFELAKVFGW